MPDAPTNRPSIVISTFPHRSWAFPHLQRTSLPTCIPADTVAHLHTSHTFPDVYATVPDPDLYASNAITHLHTPHPFADLYATVSAADTHNDTYNHTNAHNHTHA